MTDAAWLTVWLIHLLAWFVIAACITNDCRSTKRRVPTSGTRPLFERPEPETK